MKKQKGFTLIEVIIALAIVSISVVALMKSISNTSQSVQYFVDKTLSNIVLGNLVVETRILEPEKTGYKDDKYQLAGRDWVYRIHTTTQDLPMLETIQTKSEIFIYQDTASQQQKKHINHASLMFFKNNVTASEK